jgi:hypothetical protein
VDGTSGRSSLAGIVSQHSNFGVRMPFTKVVYLFMSFNTHDIHTTIHSPRHHTHTHTHTQCGGSFAFIESVCADIVPRELCHRCRPLPLQPGIIATRTDSDNEHLERLVGTFYVFFCARSRRLWCDGMRWESTHDPRTKFKIRSSVTSGINLGMELMMLLPNATLLYQVGS